MSSTPTNTKPAAAKPFALKFSSGLQPDPERILVYGSPGVGKSTFAANAPRPVFLDLEGGTSQLDVARVEGIASWDDLLAATRQLATEPHDFQTVVVDTLDRAEWLCWQKLCQTAGKGGPVASIEDIGGGFGKGYTAAYEEFRRFFALVEQLWRTRKMRVIFLAHAKLENVANPAGPDYQRYTLKVHQKVAGLFLEAVDAALFAHYEVFVRKTDGGPRQRAIGDGARFVHTSEAPTHLAKNRYGLEPRLALRWDEFAAAIAASHSPELLKATIRARVAKLNDRELAGKVEAALTSAGSDVAALVKINTRLAGRVAAAPTPAVTAAGTNDTTDTTTNESNEVSQ